MTTEQREKDARSFSDDLARLCSRELSVALKAGDQDAIAGMVERLTHSLAFTIAFGCQGQQDIMGKLLAGVESYLNEGASDMASIASLSKGAPNAE